MSNLSAKHVVAIDPLALLLPPSLYPKVVEKLHPHLPKVADVAAVLKTACPEEMEEVSNRMSAVTAYSKIVEEAVASLK